jgi:hypothetical protein
MIIITIAELIHDSSLGSNSIVHVTFIAIKLRNRLHNLHRDQTLQLIASIMGVDQTTLIKIDLFDWAFAQTLSKLNVLLVQATIITIELARCSDMMVVVIGHSSGFYVTKRRAPRS